MIKNYHRDCLTNLYLREYLMDNYQDFIANKKQVNMVLLDLRKLKMINDNYGHREGDKLLILFADALKREFGDYITVRMGGDEFLVLTNYDMDIVISKLHSIASIVRIFFEEKTTLENSPFNSGITIVSGDISQDLFYADLAMYNAKSNESIYSLFKNEHLKEYTKDKNFVDKVDNLIKNNDLVVKPILLEGSNTEIYDIKVVDDEGNELSDSELLISRKKMPKIDFSVLDSILNKHLDNEKTFIINVYQETLFNREKDYISILEENIKVKNLDPSKICINVDTKNYKGEASNLLEKFFRLEKLGVKTSIGTIDINTQQYLLPILSYCNLHYIKISKDIYDASLNDYGVMLVVTGILDILEKKKITPIFLDINTKDIDHPIVIRNKALILKKDKF